MLADPLEVVIFLLEFVGILLVCWLTLCWLLAVVEFSLVWI